MPLETESFGPPRQRLTGQVAEIWRATRDVTLMRLDPGPEAPFRFLAGQYAQLTFADLPPRDYSIGSRPDQRLLEFHIRDTGDGGSSSYVAERLQQGESVGIEGPFGRCFLREEETGPILAVAGGSGLAPMKSIIETALEGGHRQEIRLYFGVRRATDLYLRDQLEDLALRYGNFAYHLVLSEEAPNEHARGGLVTDVIAEDLPDLSGFTAYMAGPPPMVEAARGLMVRLGLPAARLYADPFLTEGELLGQGWG